MEKFVDNPNIKWGIINGAKMDFLPSGFADK
jgi:hypothetical protein